MVSPSLNEGSWEIFWNSAQSVPLALVDRDGGLIHGNSVFENFCGPSAALAGAPLTRFFHPLSDDSPALTPDDPRPLAVSLAGLGTHFWAHLFSLREGFLAVFEPIGSDDSSLAAKMSAINSQMALINREMHQKTAALERALREKEAALAELRNANLKIKTLGGLLPICSFCKNIRDDQGYWQKVEAFIAEQSPVEFTHGYCPDCLRKHFPDFAEDIIEEMDKKPR
ncbi:MAG: hypothetical protein V1816_18120 [Pseudomonadota bacterium]